MEPAEAQFELCMDEYDDVRVPAQIPTAQQQQYLQAYNKLHHEMTRFEQRELSEETGPGTAIRQISPEIDIGQTP